MVGYNSGGTCISGSNNTFLGSNTALAPGQIYISGSIALGEGATVSDYNQLMVASNVTSFQCNISGLTPSKDSTGTMIEYSSTGNIIPTSMGDFDSVSKISSAITTLQDEIVVDGSNLLIGGDWLTNYTNPTQGCSAVGYQAMQNTTTFNNRNR